MKVPLKEEYGTKITALLEQIPADKAVKELSVSFNSAARNGYFNAESLIERLEALLPAPEPAEKKGKKSPN